MLLSFLLTACDFHKHANSKIPKPPSQLRFSLLSIIITVTSNSEAMNLETQKHKNMDRNPPITDHKPWPFEPVWVKFCFLRGPLRWLTAAKNANVSWFLNFRVRVFMKSAVTFILLCFICHCIDCSGTEIFMWKIKSIKLLHVSC